MSPATIKSHSRQVSLAEIEEFEQRQGISLPVAYKEFLAKHNGGEPSPDRLFVEGWKGQSTCINSFFGLGEGHDYELAAVLENSADYVPDGMLPIAIDSGGNMLCLQTAGNQKGTVFFWDHESPGGNDRSSLFEVASSIEDILSKLC